MTVSVCYNSVCYPHQSSPLSDSMTVSVSSCKSRHLDCQFAVSHQLESQNQCPFLCLLHSHCWLLSNQHNTCQVGLVALSFRHFMQILLGATWPLHSCDTLKALCRFPLAAASIIWCSGAHGLRHALARCACKSAATWCTPRDGCLQKESSTAHP